MKTLNVLKVFLPQGSCMLLTNVVLAWEKVSMISYLPRSLFFNHILLLLDAAESVRSL